MTARRAETYADFHRRSIDDRDGFWAEQAALIDWQRPFETVCDTSRPPFARWFVGGTTNLCHNAVDRHLAERAAQPALIHVSTETDSERIYSFAELHAEVQRMAAVLLSLGVAKGDRVLLYMPMIAEAAFAMLACARIGAIHSVVFGGFASVSLASRIDDAEPKVVVSADAGSRAGKVIAYKPLLDEAIALARHKPASVVLVDRGLAPMTTRRGARSRLRGAARAPPRRAGALHLGRVDAPELHALHQRHDRPAQGRAARHRRLCGRARGEHEAHLLRQRGRDVLLDQRHRLGRRPQLHRLRAADRRHGDDHVRRLADPARRRRSGGAWSRSTRSR